MMQFKTSRLEIGPMSEEHKEAILDLLTNEIVGRTYILPEFKSRVEAEPLFYRLVELSNASDRYVSGIYYNGIFIGMMNATEVKDIQIEMGYALLPAFYNNGFATEAFSGACEYLHSHGFKIVVAGAFEGNTASIRVMEKCGMQRMEHTEDVEYRGTTHVCIYYASANRE